MIKRLRTLLLTAAIVIASGAAMRVHAQFRYAPVVGVNITDLKFKQDLFNVDKVVGGQAGIQGELMFPGIGFGIDFGLLYSQMGAKCDLGSREVWGSQGYGNERVWVHTLQIPVHVRFKWTRMDGLEDYIAPFVYGGPEFGIQVGHNKLKNAEGHGNPFKYAGGDLGLTAGGGFELWRRWQVSLQYTWGMTYLLKTKLLDNFSAQNRQWSVRVAYFF